MGVFVNPQSAICLLHVSSPFPLKQKLLALHGL
jgi:hypothetical protein